MNLQVRGSAGEKVAWGEKEKSGTGTNRKRTIKRREKENQGFRKWIF